MENCTRLLPLAIDGVFHVYDHIVGGVIVNDGAIIRGGPVIKAGVEVGRDAVVAMGSIVTKDVPADSVVIGSPARVKYSN
jgi:acetyltransferase-like isoleucine patch superfamily enzyme